MNKLITAAGVILFAACSQPDTSVEGKKKQLDELRKQLSSIEIKINTLEEEIAMSDSSEVKETGTLVRVKEINPETFNHFFEVNGSLLTDDNVMVSPEMPGQITQIKVKEGDKVSQGQVLAVIDATVLNKSIEEVESGLTLATTVYERQKKLWEQKIGSEVQFLTAKNNKEGLEKKLETLRSQAGQATIKSPISGTVERLIQKEGEMGSPGMPLMQIVSINNMKVRAMVSEAYSLSVKEGDSVTVRFSSSVDKVVRAKVSRVAKTIHPGNRTFDVEVNIPNTDNLLKPNGVAVLKFNDFRAENAVVVPSLVLTKDARGDFLYTVQSKEGKNIAVKTYVTLGKSSEGLTMITSGLTAGQKIVVEGFNEVSNGKAVVIQKPEITMN